MAQLQPAQPGAGQAGDVPVQPASGTDRHVRDCDACHQHDDHPRHHIYDPVNGDTTRHLDCCAAAGCGSCTAQLAAAPETARHGQSLIEHLTSGEA
jgi:hypothetical protein